MSALVRWTFPLVAYLCVATVISAALGYGYLRQSGKLNDETLFRITALLHGVDLAKIEKAPASAASEIPPEEASFAEQQQHLQAATLHFDAKQKQLADSLSDFDYQLKRLSEATSRYSQLKRSVEIYLQEQSSKVSDEARNKVRAQLEVMDPKKQAKPLLIRMIKDDQVDEVILLLGAMKARNQEMILKKFDTVDDLDMLYRVQQRMLAGHPAKQFIDDQVKALQQLKQQEK
jgi:hypothetical protein